MNLEETTETLLQACGLEKQAWTFGYGNPVYKDANNTYLVDKETQKVFLEYRHKEISK